MESKNHTETGLALLVLFIMPIILYVAFLGVRPLMDPDEGRYSLIPHEMNVSGDYITPHLKGVVYLEKPPLCYWAIAGAFRAFGENAFASRFFAALCAWGCILLVYDIGVFFHDRRTGLYAAALLSTSVYHFSIGQTNVLDMPLAFFVSLALWSGYRFFAEGKQKPRRIYLLYLFSALAFLTKGLIGIVFPFGILVIWLLIDHRPKDVLSLFSPVGGALFLAVTCPWLVLAQQATPDFFNFFFIHEQFLRYTTTIHHRYKPFYFFIPILCAGFIPWLGFLSEALRGLRLIPKPLFPKSEVSFLGLWAGVIFVFFSLSSSKLIPYIAPVFIPAAVFMGHLFREHEDLLCQGRIDDHFHLAQIAPVALQSLLFMIALLLPVCLSRFRIDLLHWYPLIIVPMIALILLTFLPMLIFKKYKQGWFITTYILASVFLISLLFPVSQLMAPERSARQLVQTAEILVPKGTILYQYKMCAYSLDFYNGRRTPVVDDFGELRYGIALVSEQERQTFFLSSAEFLKRYRASGKDFYCICDDQDKIDRLGESVPDLEVIWKNGEFFLLRLPAWPIGM